MNRRNGCIAWLDAREQITTSSNILLEEKGAENAAYMLLLPLLLPLQFEHYYSIIGDYGSLSP